MNLVLNILSYKTLVTVLKGFLAHLNFHTLYQTYYYVGVFFWSLAIYSIYVAIKRDLPHSRRTTND